jgi:AcrR family transcriptional regulator
VPRGVTTLTRERIVEAAASLANERGIERLTMRDLAAALGVGTMSIYYHLPDKQSVKEAVADFLWAEIAVPPKRLDWQTRMRAIATALRRAARRHPGLAALLLTRRYTGPEGLRAVEALLAAARDAGFEARGAVRCFRVLVGYVVGIAQAEVARSAVDLGASARWLKGSVAASRFPNLRAALAVAANRRFADQEFAFGLEILLEGFHRRARPRSR